MGAGKCCCAQLSLMLFLSFSDWLPFVIMDLDTNEGSCSGDHLNTSDDSALNGNQNHSQASSGISIVHVTLPQTQVFIAFIFLSLSLSFLSLSLSQSVNLLFIFICYARTHFNFTFLQQKFPDVILPLFISPVFCFCFFSLVALPGSGAVCHPANVSDPEYS